MKTPKLLLITLETNYEWASRSAFAIYTVEAWEEIKEGMGAFQIKKFRVKDISWEQADVIFDLFGSNKFGTLEDAPKRFIRKYGEN